MMKLLILALIFILFVGCDNFLSDKFYTITIYAENGTVLQQLSHVPNPIFGIRTGTCYIGDDSIIIRGNYIATKEKR